MGYTRGASFAPDGYIRRPDGLSRRHRQRAYEESDLWESRVWRPHQLLQNEADRSSSLSERVSKVAREALQSIHIFYLQHLAPILSACTPIYKLVSGAVYSVALLSQIVEGVAQPLQAFSKKFWKQVGLISKFAGGLISCVALVSSTYYAIDGIKALTNGNKAHGIDSLCGSAEWIGSGLTGLKNVFRALNEVKVAHISSQVLVTLSVASIALSLVGIGRESSRIYYLNKAINLLGKDPKKDDFSANSEEYDTYIRQCHEQLFQNEKKHYRSDYFNQRFEFSKDFLLKYRERVLFKEYIEAKEAFERASATRSSQENLELANTFKISRENIVQFYRQAEMRLKENRVTHLLNIAARVCSIAAAVLFVTCSSGLAFPILTSVAGVFGILSFVYSMQSTLKTKNAVRHLVGDDHPEMVRYRQRYIESTWREPLIEALANRHLRLQRPPLRRVRALQGHSYEV